MKKEPLVVLLIHRQSARRMAGPVLLIIRDGWGINPGGRDKRKENGDATLLASTPFHEKLYRDYPGSKLSASGGDVGLPEGQMGNSEVGHLNLGAGRIVYQDLTRINKAIKEGELTRNRVLQETFARARGHRLHLLGLVSDGGVHSHYSHMIALANAAHDAGVAEIFVHAFTDGRDTSPTGGATYLKICEKELEKSGGQIVTVVGQVFCDGSRSALGPHQKSVGRRCSRPWRNLQIFALRGSGSAI